MSCRRVYDGKKREQRVENLDVPEDPSNSGPFVWRNPARANEELFVTLIGALRRMAGLPS